MWYTLIQRNPNSWLRTPQGDIHEIVSDCGHKHRTLTGAIRCELTFGPLSQLGYFGRLEDADGTFVEYTAEYETALKAVRGW